VKSNGFYEAACELLARDMSFKQKRRLSLLEAVNDQMI